MAIQHELSWSVSRSGTFAGCRRRYYYDYYGSWGGWDRRAPDERQKAYLLKKMTRMPMLAGDCVHRALARWFEARRAGRPMEPGEVEAFALGELREGYRTSRDGKWRSRPSKLTHLAEHHYAEPRIDEATGAAGDYGKRYVERIRAAVTTFFEHPELAVVRELDPARYLAFEDLDAIELFGTKTYAVPDFAFEEPTEGGRRVHVYDWKTGQPREQDRFQLAAYALYAGAKWGAGPADVVCVDVYLGTGELQAATYTQAELDATLGRIEGSLTEMAALHFDADREAGDVERFPMLTDAADRECRTCNYRELCGR